MLPADVGCIVENVGTIYAIQRAVCCREPLFTHVFTLTGDAVKNPGNFIVRDGASFAELLEFAGGLKDGVTLKKALCGGPMMGIAMPSLDVPIQKQNNGLTLLAEDEAEAAEGPDDGLPALRPLHHGLPAGPDAPADGRRQCARATMSATRRSSTAWSASPAAPAPISARPSGR